MTEFVDKETIGLTGPQYHVGVSEGEISDIVLMPGDPFRVQLIADKLDDAVEVAHKREYRTMNGTYKGRLITVCSSGMGCPSTAIGVEELARVGGRVFIRVGSTAALQPHVGGRRRHRQRGLAAERRDDGRVRPARVSRGSRLRADGDAQAASPTSSVRATASPRTPGSTPPTTRSTPRRPSGSRSSRGVGMLNVEMESSALFVVARQRGLRAAMVCAVSANLVTGDVVYGAPNTRLHTGWEHSIDVALEAVHRLGL